MTVVVDYEAGNLTSVKTALKHIHADFEVTSCPERLRSADKVIFPGVGEARHAMGVLQNSGMDEALREFAASGKPLFGICLGCQILQDYSEERDTPLLGIIPGRVRRFPGGMGVKVPHIGWNTVRHTGEGPFRGIPQDSSFYFVHSYYLSVELADGSASPWVSGRSDYGLTFAAALLHENVWAAQFHPEKSGPKGLALLGNFVKEA